MKQIVVALLVPLLWSTFAYASTNPAFLSDTEIRLTTTFHGLKLNVTGYAANDEDGHLPDVLIHIYGPPADYIVREKQRLFGFWVNSESLSVKQPPSYQWLLATPGAERRLDDFNSLNRYQYQPGSALLASTPWRDGFEESMERLGYYGHDQSGVLYRDEGLYSATAYLPATLLPGTYHVTIILAYIDGKRETRTLVFDARRARLSALLSDTITEQPLLYALISILLALASGYLVATGFRY